MRKLIFYIIITVFTCHIHSRTWSEDISGNGYKATTIVMPEDYSGKVISTLIKKTCAQSSVKSILYIHGYNDYFFQKEMGDTFCKHGYNFYAIDLRKYGRSILPGQKKFETRNLTEYFSDIDSALSIIKSERNKDIILMGHSTGGLIAAYYMVKVKNPAHTIKALILNSPFMDMNLDDTQEKYLLPMISTVSRLLPSIEIDQNSNDAYAQSLMKNHHGEWEYNTHWKMPLSPAVTTGWLGAIHKAQTELQKGTNIKVPILLMRSGKSVDGNKWNPEFNTGDAVLDVEEISVYGRKLGLKVQELVVKDGLHDLFLSRKPVRKALYTYIFNWLDKNIIAAQ